MYITIGTCTANTHVFITVFVYVLYYMYSVCTCTLVYVYGELAQQWLVCAPLVTQVLICFEAWAKLAQQ